MKITRTSGLAGILALVLAATAQAATVEGFESTTLDATNAIGDASIRTPSYFGLTPQEGTKMLLLTTINNTNDSPTVNQSGTNAATIANVNTFVGANAGTLRNTRGGQLASATGQEGSAFELNLGALGVGDQISFRYNFLTSDTADTTNDFAFYTLNGQTSNLATDQIVADTSDAGTAFGAGSPFNLQSGWLTKTITITSAGSYILDLGVVDATNLVGVSGLLVDNISVTAVPEPSTIGLFLAGAASLVAVRRRLKK